MNFKTIFKSLKNKTMLKRVMIVIGLLVIYRMLAHIPVPLGEPTTFQEAIKNLLEKSDFGNFLNLISGGGFTAFSILLVGISVDARLTNGPELLRCLWQSCNQSLTFSCSINQLSSQTLRLHILPPQWIGYFL